MKSSVAGFALAAAFAAALIAVPATAGTITYDQDLGGPGWFDGSGNPNGGFTVDTETSGDGDGIVLALRVKLRSDPNVIHSPDGVYTVPLGLQNAGHALWNWEFSIDLTNSQYTLDDVIATLTVSKNGGAPVTSGVAPLDIPDNAISGEIAQNSENPLFFQFFPDGFLSVDEAATYLFTLTLSNQAGAPLASDSITVNAVPEPATLALLGTGLAGVFAARRRRKA